MSTSAEILKESEIFQRDYALGLVICGEAKEKLRLLDDALAECNDALAADPDNLKLRKVVWNEVKRLRAIEAELRIERNLSMSSEKQVAYIGAYFKTDWYCCSAMGSNRGGKTFISATALCKWLRDDAPNGAMVWCIAPTAEKSVDTQQKYLWEMLPKRYLGNQVWDEKNGFGSKNPMLIFDPNGKRITVKFKSMSQFTSDPASFESVSVHRIWIDEWVSEDAWSSLQLRLADTGGRIMNSTIIHPDYDCAWMYETIWMAQNREDFRLYVFTVHDNPVITLKTIERMYAAIPDREQQMLRIEGRPILAGSFVFGEFDDLKHVVPLRKFPTDLTWYAGMDVGMDHPTVWLLVGVDKQGRYWVAKEYTSRNTTTDTDASCILTMLKEGVNGEKNIQLEDDTYIDPAAFQVNKSNQVSVGDQYFQYGLPVSPSLSTKKVGEWNQVYQIKMDFKNDQMFIADDCTMLIRNLKMWKFKRDRQGKPIGSDSFEDKNNDACFPAGTLVDTPLGAVKIEDVKEGDVVLCRDGETVVEVGGTMTGIKPTINVCINGRVTLECTPEHQLMSSDGRWIEAQNSNGVQLCKSNHGQMFTESLLNTSNMAEKIGIATQQGVVELGSISADAQPSMGRQQHFGYINKCSKILMEKFQKAIMSITKMETWETIAQAILSQFMGTCTQNNIIQKTSKRLNKHQKHGTSQMQVESGIENMQSKLPHNKFLEMQSAQYAEKNTCQNFPVNTVVEIVGQKTEESQGLTTLPASVQYAESTLQKTNTVKVNAAHSDVEQKCVSSVSQQGIPKAVYCIKTKAGNFSVSGIIVKNCDALKYVRTMDIVYKEPKFRRKSVFADYNANPLYG